MTLQHLDETADTQGAVDNVAAEELLLREVLGGITN
jgi:hypothetical protein